MHKIWLFDLDNTLHDATPHIFPHINRSMTAYLQRHLRLSEEDGIAQLVEIATTRGRTDPSSGIFRKPSSRRRKF